MSSAMDKAVSTPSPTKTKWTPNLGRSDREEQASINTAASTASPIPADASTSTQSMPEDLEEKENVSQEGQNPQDPTMRKAEDALNEQSSQQRQHQQQKQQNSEKKQSSSAKSHKGQSSSKKKASTTTSTNNNKMRTRPLSSSMKLKKRKRGRYVRVAAVNDISTKEDISNTKVTTFPPLPRNQYRATLRRRAIRKFDEGSSAPSSVVTAKSTGGIGLDEDDPNYEEYGDISLGMKLIVAGGRVIVQKLIPLSDGRASPAQLVGVIQRGDVLLSIDNLSLVNLPIDQLMEGLKPLSSPGDNGSYQRVLQLRFETGVGSELLKNHEKAQAATKERNESLDAANDMFSLFPMVDQLSGQPLFQDYKVEVEEDKTKPRPEDDEDEKTVTPRAGSSSVPGEKNMEHDKNETPDTLISSILAKQRIQDRKRFASEFFVYKDDLSVWLRTTMGMKYGGGAVNGNNEHHSQIVGMGMTQLERLEKGTKVMAAVKALSYNMEDIDRGKDMRSFVRWNTTLSLRSRASVRRRHVLDSASLPADRVDSRQSAIDEIDSVNSGFSGSLEGVDGDELLLGLAAHDGIWRKQVVEALNNAIVDMEKSVKSDAEQEEEEEGKVDNVPLDSAITRQLGSFLFGENMSRIITKKKKSYALPPEEVTSVLFDLTTNIASSAPDEITVFGGQPTSPSHQGSSQAANHKKKQSASAQSSDVILATRFILEEALPIWLQSFRPLPWEERRVLWPRIRYAATTDSYGGTNTIFSDDSLTVESVGSARSPGRGKNLREIIEDQELDIEARAETCFLVTFYFTQKVLAGYMLPYEERKPSSLKSVHEEAIRFIKLYGSYLQMHTSLSYAALVRAKPVIDQLLSVASNDPSHRDATREIQKGNNLTFYDNCKLSAVLKFLGILRYEAKPERRQVLVNLCVSAYPDVQPWQFRSACLDPLSETMTGAETKQPCSEETMKEVFYTYLSQLLHPLEGHNAARRDEKLVKEWCELSVGSISLSSRDSTNKKSDASQKARLQNFFSVASRASSNHLVYRRDLEMLLGLSMGIAQHDLALDLAGEILETNALLSKDNVLQRVLRYLREIALDALTLARDREKNVLGFRTLKRVLRLFHKMSTSTSSVARESIVVADELYALLLRWKADAELGDGDPEALDLIDFFVAESAPSDVLHALLLWSDSHDLGSSMLSRLDEILRRGVNASLRSELSGSLLRLKYARLKLNEGDSMVEQERDSSLLVGAGIWKKMSRGDLPIDK